MAGGGRRSSGLKGSLLPLGGGGGKPVRNLFDAIGKSSKRGVVKKPRSSTSGSSSSSKMASLKASQQARSSSLSFAQGPSPAQTSSSSAFLTSLLAKEKKINNNLKGKPGGLLLEKNTSPAATANSATYALGSELEMFVGVAKNSSPGNKDVRELARKWLADCTPWKCHVLYNHSLATTESSRLDAAYVVFDSVEQATKARRKVSVATKCILEVADRLETGESTRGGGWRARAVEAMCASSKLGNTTDVSTIVLLAATPPASAAASLALARVASRTMAGETPPTLATGKALKNVPTTPRALNDVIRKELLNADPIFESRYLGIATGKPLPAHEAEVVHRMLDALDWKEMGNVRAASINVENSFSLGLSTKALPTPPAASSASSMPENAARDVEVARPLLSSDPYRTPFAFKDRTGAWDGARVRKKHAVLWQACMDLLRKVDPHFKATSIGFNKNFRGSPHRDEKDAGMQIVCGLGDYEGGMLRVHAPGGTLDVDTKQRSVKVDGRYVHSVQPFSGTVRYSVVFYALQPDYAVDPSSTVEGVGA